MTPASTSMVAPKNRRTLNVASTSEPRVLLRIEADSAEAVQGISRAQVRMGSTGNRSHIEKVMTLLNIFGEIRDGNDEVIEIRGQQHDSMLRHQID